MASPGEGRRNLRVIFLGNLLDGAYVNLLQVVLQPFVVRLAGSVFLLSVLQALSTRLGGIVGALAQLAGGHLADRWGRKPTILLGAALNAAGLSLFLATALSSWAPLLLPASVLLGVGLLASPAHQSIVAESVEAEGRAVAYSQVLFWAMLPAAAMAFLGGYVAAVVGYYAVFGICLGLEVVVLALFALLLRETLRVRDVEPWSLRRLLRLQEPRLRGVLIVTTVDLFVWTITILIIYGMAIQEFGFTETDIGLIVGVWAVTFWASALPVGRLVQRFGSRGMIFVSESLGIPIMIGWILARTPLEFAAISVLNGITAGTWVPALQTLIANSVDDRVRGRATGQLTAIRGLFAFPAPFLGGLLYDSLGYAAPMSASLVGIVVTLALILRFIHDPPRP